MEFFLLFTLFYTPILLEFINKKNAENTFWFFFPWGHKFVWSLIFWKKQVGRLTNFF